MSVTVPKIKAREQIITARRIAFRRNLTCNESASHYTTATPEKHVVPIQQIHNYSQFQLLPTLEPDNKNLPSQTNNPQLWSRCKNKKYHSSTEDNILEAVGDFQAYQDGNLGIFLDDSTTKRVSDVCLVNDNFILVKMPQKTNSSPTEIECLVQKQTDKKLTFHGNTCNQMESESQIKKPRRLVPKMNNIKRIQPIISQPDDAFKVSSMVTPNMRHIHWKNDAGDKIDESQIKMVKPVRQDSPFVGSALKKNVFSSSNFPTSVHKRVEMQQQGALVYLDEENKIENMECPQQVENLSHQKRRKVFEAFHWIFNPFCVRLRRRKRPKPKPKIQAVVHKTYFVRWSKPAASKCCSENKFRFIRRIRSALF